MRGYTDRQKEIALTNNKIIKTHHLYHKKTSLIDLFLLITDLFIILIIIYLIYSILNV